MPVSAVIREDPGSWRQRLSLALHPSCEALQTPSLAVRVAGGQDQEHYWAWRWRVAQLPLLSPLLETVTCSSGELVILLAPEFVEEECRALRELLTANDPQTELGGLWELRPVGHEESMVKVQMVIEEEGGVHCETVATKSVETNLNKRKTLPPKKDVNSKKGDVEETDVENGNGNQVDLEEQYLYQGDVNHVKKPAESGTSKVKSLEKKQNRNEKVVISLDKLKRTKSNVRNMAQKRLEDTDNWMLKPTPMKRARKAPKYVEDSSDNSDEEHNYIEKSKKKETINVRGPGCSKVEPHDKSNKGLKNRERKKINNMEQSPRNNNGQGSEENDNFMLNKRHLRKMTQNKGKLDTVMFRLQKSNYFHPSRSLMKRMKTSFVQKLARKEGNKATYVEDIGNNNNKGNCIMCSKPIKNFRSNYAKHLSGVHFKEQLKNFFSEASDGGFDCNFCSYKGKTSSYISEHVGGVHKKLQEVASREVIASIPGRRLEEPGVEVNTLGNFNIASSPDMIDDLIDSVSEDETDMDYNYHSYGR